MISNLVGNRRSRLVAKAVIDICRQLGAVVMASGVETQDQVNVLEELGCDYAQDHSLIRRLRSRHLK